MLGNGTRHIAALTRPAVYHVASQRRLYRAMSAAPLLSREMNSPVGGGFTVGESGGSARDADDDFALGASAMNSGGFKPGKAGGAAADQAEGEMHILANNEGFEFFVFLPQLFMRLFPPLMLLQLFPDYRPRADRCLFSLGVSAICAGAGKSLELGFGVLLTLLSCPAVIKAVYSRANGQKEPGEGHDKPHKLKYVLLVTGLAAISSYAVRFHRDENFLEHQNGCVSCGRVTAIAGLVIVLVVLFVWGAWVIHWAVCRDWSGTSEFKNRISTWSKPQLRFLSDLFVERFPLGELQVSDDSLKRSLAGSSWVDGIVGIPVGKLYKDNKVVRLKQICRETMASVETQRNDGETGERWGVLRPTRVQRVEKTETRAANDGDAWALKWEQYSPQEHSQLHLEIRYDHDLETIQLRKETAHRPADDPTHQDTAIIPQWSHQGGDYTTGYRVDGGNGLSDKDGVAGDYVNNLKSVGERDPGRLEFTQQSANQLGKHKLLHVSRSERNSSSDTRDRQMANGFWIVAAPQQRITVSSGGMNYDYGKYETIFEAEQPAAKNWTVSGPPSGATGQWAPTSPLHRKGHEQPDMREFQQGVSRPVSPQRGQHEVPTQSEPEPETRSVPLKVHGFVRAEYEIVFPRRLDLTFQTWLGATVRASDHVEFQILQVENFLWSSFQLVAILLMMQVYAINTQDFVDRSGDPSQSSWFWTAKEFWVDQWPGYLSADWVNRTFMSNDDQSSGMRLEESEVLLPAMMYVFLCFVGASEHAMFSGMDTLSESREDRWYRRAEKSWRDIQKQKKDRNPPTTCLKCDSCHSSFAKKKGHFVVAGLSLLFGLVMSWAFFIRDQTGWQLLPILQFVAAALLVLASLVLADALDIFRIVKEGFYRLLLRIFLFCTDKVCADGEKKEPRDFDWFRRHVSHTDLYLRTSFRLDKRDEMRKHELTLTYIEAPMWSEYREEGPDGFKTHFEQVDDAVIYSDISELRQKMKVFKMDLPEGTTSGSELVRTRSPANSSRRFLRGTSVFHGTLTDYQKTLLEAEDTCMSVGHIADMIIYLSKARRLVHARRTTLICAAISLLHAAVPFWHAWLPKKLGGQCGVDDHGCVWQWHCSNNTVLSVPFDAGKLFACSSSWAHVRFHLLSAAVNLSLTYAILNRLFKCQADYYARYCHMLYFIQLTPWSNLQHHHIKDHWGLLPSFDLNTPGNVEAWNKLRLYLQSAQIKSSRFKQVSVLWCFCAVVLMAVVKIAEMVVVESRKVAATDCSKFFEGSNPGRECDSTIGCQWVGPNPALSDQSRLSAPSLIAPFGSNQNQCKQIDCEKINDESKCTLDASNQWCTWNFGHQQCERAEQHFDTMSLFVVVETLIFGLGLIYTLWQGMKSNEIKTEAFPYVVRMKYSELLSNAMNFVSERAQWESHRQSWRTAEVELLSITKKLKSVQAVPTPAADDDSVQGKGTQAQIEQQQKALLVKKM
eukprot:COSAG02_NODE_1225_length_13785_cov_12.911588_6_plen_1460_part_00